MDPTLVAILKFGGESFSAGILALLGMLLYEPKKHRILELRTELDRLEQLLNDTHFQATHYWSTSGDDAIIENTILRNTTDCFGIITRIPPSCYNPKIKDYTKKFFEEITSGDFRNARRAPNPLTIQISRRTLKDIKREVAKSKPKFDWNALFLKKI